MEDYADDYYVMVQGECPFTKSFFI